jgi:hypothetical protein
VPLTPVDLRFKCAIDSDWGLHGSHCVKASGNRLLRLV